jgi:8-oxo-dGTP pyrophosphatase MutT (NUDIX family)
MAAREAFEEAGVRGKIGKRPYGSYQYRKRLTDDSTVQCRVAVYLLQVEEELEEWPERAERERRWISWFQVPLYSRRIGLTMLLLRFGFTGKSAQSRQVSGTCAAGRSSAQVLKSIIGDIKR